MSSLKYKNRFAKHSSSNFSLSFYSTSSSQLNFCQFLNPKTIDLILLLVTSSCQEQLSQTIKLLLSQTLKLIIYQFFSILIVTTMIHCENSLPHIVKLMMLLTILKLPSMPPPLLPSTLIGKRLMQSSAHGYT